MRINRLRILLVRQLVGAFALMLPLAAAAPVVAEEPVEIPTPSPVWTVGSPDCTGVHADGEPWLECGFQAFDSLPDLSRILTVSNRGKVQLWNGAGAEIAAVDQPDEPGGASGHPDGRALISASAAVAITSYNQLLVLDAVTGAERLRKTLPFMTVDLLRLVGTKFALIEYKDQKWGTGYGALDLMTGELVREFESLAVTNSAWAAGAARRKQGGAERWALLMNDETLTEIEIKRGCAPLNAPGLCAAWDYAESSAVEIFDVSAGDWTSYRLPNRLVQNTILDTWTIDGRVFFLLCKPPPAGKSTRACIIVDLKTGEKLYRFTASWAQFVKPSRSTTPDTDGMLVEIRNEIELGDYETRVVRVSPGGAVTEIFRTPTTSYVAAPDGGFAVIEGYKQHHPFAYFDQLLLDAEGAPRARLPKMFGWVDLSEDGSRLLTAAYEMKQSDGGLESFTHENHTGLALFVLPPAQSGRPN